MSISTCHIWPAIFSACLLSCTGGEFGSVAVNNATDSSGLSGESLDLEESLEGESGKTIDQEVIIETSKDEDESDRGKDSGKAGDKQAAKHPSKGKNNNDQAGKQELQICASKLGISSDRLHIAGSSKLESMSINKGLVAKVTGNQNRLNLNISGEGKIPGVCVFLAGNKNELHLKTQLSLANILLISRGNQSKAYIQVEKGSSVDSINWDARGNQASLSIQGEGDYPCPVSGFQGQLSCE